MLNVKLTLHKYKTLTKAKNIGHRNNDFPGGKKKALLKVTELSIFLPWMDSDNHVSKDWVSLGTFPYQLDNHLF